MISIEQLRREKRISILALAAQHGAHNVRVFGSVVHGENGPKSDIDFLVDLDPGRDLFDLGALLADLKDLLQTNVDLVEAGVSIPIFATACFPRPSIFDCCGATRCQRKTQSST